MNYLGSDGKTYEPGDEIIMKGNLTLTAQWKKRNVTATAETVLVTYEAFSGYYNTGTEKTVSVTAMLSQTSNTRATVTFITGNNQDTINAQRDNFYAWEIGGNVYPFNTQVTVTATRTRTPRGYTSWSVTATPVEDTSLSSAEARAQFFVRKADAIGYGEANKYYSVGTGVINAETFGDLGIVAGSDNIDDNVEEYIVQAPSTAQIANLMNISLDEASAVRWYVIKNQSDGYHVDGVVYLENVYWRAEFIDPDNNTVEQTLVVKDSEKLDTAAVLDGSNLDTNLRTFLYWSTEPDGDPVNLEDLSIFVEDRQFYAVFERYAGYTVEYREEGTEKELATPTTHQVVKGTTVKASSLTPATIANYEVTRRTPDTIRIESETGNYKFIIYYTKYVTINYEAEAGGTVSQPAETNVKPATGTVAGSTARPAAGYEFAGWTLKEDADFSDDAAKLVPDKADDNQSPYWTDRTYVAHFTPKTDTAYTVQYYYQGNDGYTMDLSEKYQGTTDTTVRIIADEIVDPANDKCTKNGAYIFDEGHEENVLEGVVLGDGTLVLKLYFNRNTAQVTYAYEETQPEGAPALPNNGEPYTETIGAEVTVQADLALTGYDFVGWHTGDGALVAVTDGTPSFTMPSGSVTLYGKFVPATDTAYTVEHYLGTENQAGKYEYTLQDTEYLAGTTGEPADYAPKIDGEYANYVYQEELTVWEDHTHEATSTALTVAADGSLVIKLYYHQKFGRIGYNLVLKEASIVAPATWETNGISGGGAQKYVDNARRYVDNETYTATTVQPTAAGYKFIAWLDKEYHEYGSRIVFSGGNGVYNRGTTKDGIQTLDAIWASVNAQDVTFTYDGKEHTIAPAIMQFNNGTLDQVYVDQLKEHVEMGDLVYSKDGESWGEPGVIPTFTDVGEYQVYVKGTVNVGERDFDLQTSATVTITRRPVTITVADAEKTYGHDDPTFADAEMDGEVPGELGTIDLSVTRSDAGDETVGVHEDVLTIGETKEKLEAAYTNYEFTVTPGDFTIKTNEADLTVAAENVEKVYDGTAYGVEAKASIAGAEIRYWNEAMQAYDLEESPTITNVSESVLTVKFQATLEGYTPATGEATVTITRRPVTITVANAEKTYGYDDPTFADAEMDGEVPGELGTIDLSVTRSDAGDETVGVHEDVLTIGETKEELEAAYTNYEFTVTPGDFTIKTNEADLTVAAENVVKVYDGTAYGVEAKASIAGAEIRYWNEETQEYNLEESPTITNVSESVLTVKFQATLEGYAPATGEATVTIIPRPVKVTVNSKTYAYDGTEKTVADTDGLEYTVEGESQDRGLLDGDVISLNVVYGKNGAESQTLVGDYEAKGQKHTVVISNGNVEETGNYAVTIVAGLLKITDGDDQQPVDPDAVLNKTHLAGKYGLEEVSFTITVKNIYNEPKTIIIREQPGVTLTDADEEGKVVFTDVPAGETRTAQATYTITEADILEGTFTNNVTAEFINGKTITNDDTVELEDSQD